MMKFILIIDSNRFHSWEFCHFFLFFQEYISWFIQTTESLYIGILKWHKGNTGTSFCWDTLNKYCQTFLWRNVRVIDENIANR